MSSLDDVAKVLALDEPKLGDGTAINIAALAPPKPEADAKKGQKRKAEDDAEEESSDDEEAESGEEESDDGV